MVMYYPDNEWPTPSSNEMTIIIDHGHNIYIELEVSIEHCVERL